MVVIPVACEQALALGVWAFVGGGGREKESNDILNTLWSVTKQLLQFHACLMIVIMIISFMIIPFKSGMSSVTTGDRKNDRYGRDYRLVIQNDDDHYGQKSDCIVRTRSLWSKNRLAMKMIIQMIENIERQLVIRMSIAQVQSIDWQIKNWKGLEEKAGDTSIMLTSGSIID